MIGAGIAEVPYAGGVGDLDPFSVADPLPGLLQDPSVPRIYLFRSGASAVDVDPLDVASESVFTDGRQFESALPSPYSFGVALQAPEFAGLARTRPSNVVVKNPVGQYDAHAGIEWLGASAEIYLGPRGTRGQQDIARFTRILNGVSKEIVFDPDTITVILRDQAFAMGKRFAEELFMGTGACLRFDGSGDRVDYGDVLDKGAGDSFTAEILVRMTSTGGFKTLMGKKLSGASAGWLCFTDTANGISCQVGDGATAATAFFSDAAIWDGKWHRIAMVVDRALQVVRSYADGELRATSSSIAAIGTLANAESLRVGARGDGGVVMDGDLDDFRMWNAVRGQIAIADDAFGELEGSEGGLDLYSKYNEGSGGSALDSSGNGLTGTITGATWIGSLEGDAATAGRVKPDAYGLRRQVGPVLVDPQRGIWQVHTRSCEAIDAVRVNGDDFTLGSDVADIFDGGLPSAGTYNVARTAVGTYIRMNVSGTEHEGRITCDVRGDNSGTLGYQDTVSGIARKILTERCGYTGLDDLVLTTFNALETAQPAVVGYYFDEEASRAEILHRVMAGAMCWAVMNRASAWEVGRIGDPDGLTPTVTFDVDSDNVESLPSTPISVLPREVRVSYRPYHQTLDPEQVATGVDAAVRDDFGKDIRWGSRRASNFFDLPDDAAVLEIHSAFDTKADARAEAQRILDWLALKPRLYPLRLKQGALAHYVGTLSSLVWSRYGLSAGKSCWVVAVDETGGTNAEADTVEVTLCG
jgi:hypothetical protein